jgi:hypothetical protein
LNDSFHCDAEAELVAAIDYYEECEYGLGEDFSLEVYSAIHNIISYPLAWPIIDDPVRRCLVHRFPFGVLYSVEADRIYVLAIMNLNRHPDYWKSRK